MKVSELIRLIKRSTRCYKIRSGANHDIWFNPDTGVEFLIPRHRSQELPRGTERNIKKAAGLL